MGRGTREELDALLESAWEGQRKRQKWAEAHPAEPAVMPRPSRNTPRQSHPVARYVFRVLGVATLSLGGAGLMEGISFSWSAFFVASGLVLLIIDPWIEPTLLDHSVLWRIGCSLFFAALLFLFANFVVFLPSPLNVRARDYNNDYSPDTVIAGIKWESEYSDLRLVFENPTDNAYKNLDVTIEPGVFVVAEAQTTNLSGVQVFNTDRGQDIPSISQTDAKTGRPSYVKQGDYVLYSQAVRVLCETLPKHTEFEVVLALDNPPNGTSKTRPPFGGPRTPSKVVIINGTYESKAGRPHKLSQAYPVELR
jgi:hypothetical protein